MTTDILVTQEKHLGLITLNRPEALNALTLSMIKALQHQLQRFEMDENVHAVVIRAIPGKAFCAGGDIRCLYDAGRKCSPHQLEFFWHEYRLNASIARYSKPYIALMDGVTMGGGVGIALHGSHSVASERFMFAMPETSIGFFPDIGASYLLSRCPNFVGIYLGLTGQRVNAVDACALGLVTQWIAADKFPRVLDALHDADLTAHAHERVTECLQHFAMPLPKASLSELHTVMKMCFQLDNMEAIIHALDSVQEPWHQDTAKILAQKSPLSLKVTLAQLQKAGSLTLEECLTMDYCLVKHFMNDPDFYEGVRAVLVDKDKTPHWQPKTLADVTPELVARYFQECGAKLEF